MLKYEDRCCNCATGGYPCMGRGCPNIDVPVYYCDKCGGELYPKEMYEADGKDLCRDCLFEIFRKEV